MYQVAFLQNDAAGMAQQIARAKGVPGFEAQLPNLEGDTAAYVGLLRHSREYSRHAIDSAKEAGQIDAPHILFDHLRFEGSLVRQQGKRRSIAFVRDCRAPRLAMCSILLHSRTRIQVRTAPAHELAQTIWRRNIRKTPLCNSTSCRPCARRLLSRQRKCL